MKVRVTGLNPLDSERRIVLKVLASHQLGLDEPCGDFMVDKTVDVAAFDIPPVLKVNDELDVESSVGWVYKSGTAYYLVNIHWTSADGNKHPIKDVSWAVWLDK